MEIRWKYGEIRLKYGFLQKIYCGQTKSFGTHVHNTSNNTSTKLQLQQIKLHIEIVNLKPVTPTTILLHLKDQYGPRVFFLEFPFFAENMIIRLILNLWWHSEILKLILGVFRGMFTKRLKGTHRLLYTVKSDFFEMTALHSKC